MCIRDSLSLAGGYGLTRFAGSRPDAAAMLALCVAALCTMPTLSREMRFDEYIAFGEGDNTAYTYREYTIPGSDVERTTAVSYTHLDVYKRQMHGCPTEGGPHVLFIADQRGALPF